MGGLRFRGWFNLELLVASVAWRTSAVKEPWKAGEQDFRVGETHPQGQTGSPAVSSGEAEDMA